MNTPLTDTIRVRVAAGNYDLNDLLNKLEELERWGNDVRNAAAESIKELNDRLIERQESFQAQLIRIENTWREKLQKANNQNRELEMRLYAAQLQLAK